MFQHDTDGMVSDLVVVRNLPYSLAEVSFLSLDSACRSPVTLFILFLSFFPYVGSTYLAPLVPRCHFQEMPLDISSIVPATFFAFVKCRRSRAIPLVYSFPRWSMPLGLVLV